MIDPLNDAGKEAICTDSLQESFSGGLGQTDVSWEEAATDKRDYTTSTNSGNISRPTHPRNQCKRSSFSVPRDSNNNVVGRTFFRPKGSTSSFGKIQVRVCKAGQVEATSPLHDTNVQLHFMLRHIAGRTNH